MERYLISLEEQQWKNIFDEYEFYDSEEVDNGDWAFCFLYSEMCISIDTKEQE